jgi:hypothetical protein
MNIYAMGYHTTMRVSDPYFIHNNIDESHIHVC